MAQPTGPLPELPPVIKNKGFKLIEKVGSGAFSQVYKASWTKMPKEDLAAKIIDLSKVDHLWVMKCLKNEMKIIKSLRHPNIVKTYELVKTRSMAYIFMDLAKNGSIEEVLIRTKAALPEPKAKKYFKDILSGIEYIHDRGIAHRDIKPDNFLIDESDRAKLADFGFSCYSVGAMDTRVMRGTFCGTREYMAIEIKLKKEGEAYDAKAADLYSLGISLYLMVYMDIPFNVDNEEDCIRKQKVREFRHKTKIHTSQPLKDLIYALLDPNPKSRLTARAVQRSAWVTTD